MNCRRLGRKPAEPESNYLRTNLLWQIGDIMYGCICLSIAASIDRTVMTTLAPHHKMRIELVVRPPHVTECPELSEYNSPPLP